MSVVTYSSGTVWTVPALCGPTLCIDLSEGQVESRLNEFPCPIRSRLFALLCFTRQHGCFGSWSGLHTRKQNAGSGNNVDDDCVTAGAGVRRHSQEDSIVAGFTAKLPC